MKLTSLFTKPVYGKLLLSFSAIFFLAYNLNYEPRIDDGFLGEQLFWLYKLGYVKSNLMSGFRNIGIENLWTVYHKGCIYFGYIWAKLFGWSIYSLHISSQISALVFLFLLWKYFSKEKNRFSPNAFYIVAAVCLLFYYFNYATARFRPEILELTLGFATFLTLDKFLLTQKKGQLLMGSITAGLAMLCHLNGLIVIAAGAIVLAFNKKWIASILFGILSVLVFGITYFADVVIFTDFSYWFNQFMNDPALDSEDFKWYTQLLKVTKEYLRYFHADVNSILAIPFFTVFVLTLKKQWKISKNMIVYMAGMMVILSFYSYNKKAIFMLPILPYMAILFIQGVHLSMVDTHRKIIRIVVSLMLILYFIGGAYMMVVKIKQVNKVTLLEQNKEVGAIIGDNNRVLADECFIFNQIENQEFIVNVEQFRFFRSFHGKKNLTFEEVINEIYERDLEYFLVRIGAKREFESSIKNDDPRYTIVAKNDKYILLKFNSPETIHKLP